MTGYAQYREAAVLAALAELRQRGQPAPEEATLRPQLEAVVAQAAAAGTQPSQPPPADPAALPPKTSRCCTRRASSCCFRCCSTPIIAGAVLLAINMRRLKQTRMPSGG
ncbi:MAG: hypothetical protein WKG07_21850 [Hymenobacter sp.]